jgi:hypothetical protein
MLINVSAVAGCSIYIHTYTIGTVSKSIAQKTNFLLLAIKCEGYSNRDSLVLLYKCTHIENIEKTVQQDLDYLGILHHQKITQWLQSIGLQDVDDLQGEERSVKNQGETNK